MSRYASACDMVRQNVLSIKYYHAVAGCRGAPRSVAACRGQPGRVGKWKVPLRGLERDAMIVALLLARLHLLDSIFVIFAGRDRCNPLYLLIGARQNRL